MERKLITCSVCGTDQQIRAGKIRIHSNNRYMGKVRCLGSGRPVVEEPTNQETPKETWHTSKKPGGLRSSDIGQESQPIPIGGMKTYCFELRNNDNEKSIEAETDEKALERLNDDYQLENIERVYVKEKKGFRTVYVPQGSSLSWEDTH